MQRVGNSEPKKKPEWRLASRDKPLTLRRSSERNRAFGNEPSAVAGGLRLAGWQELKTLARKLASSRYPQVLLRFIGAHWYGVISAQYPLLTAMFPGAV